VAIGSNANATGNYSVGIGYLTDATEDSAVAIGKDAKATAGYSLAAGASAMAGAEGATAVGHAANAKEPGSTAIGEDTIADGNSATALGYKAHSVGVDATAVGSRSYAEGFGATSLGLYAGAIGENATALGSSAAADGANATAVGFYSYAAADAVAVGADANASGASSAAFGNAANASADQAVAIGQGAQATLANSVALGAGSSTQVGKRDSYTGYGLTGTQSSVGEVNVGNRTISGVAAGLNDDEAVNVAQLKGVTTKVDTIAETVEGAVKYDRNPDGTINKNSVTLEGDPAAGGTALHNVAAGTAATDAVNVGQLNDAVSQVNNAIVNSANPFFSAEGDRDTEGAVSSGTQSVASGAKASATGTGSAAYGAGATASGAGSLAAGQNASASGSGSTAIGSGSKATDANSVALGQNSVTDRANSVSVGSAGQERQITHVAPGTQGTDAVNVNQLKQASSNTLKQANDYTNSKFDSARKDAFGGAAAALAVAGLPQAVLPGRGMVAVGGGTYGGQSALAIGVSQLSENGTWVYKATGTTSTRGEFGVSLGAGMHW